MAMIMEGLTTPHAEDKLRIIKMLDSATVDAPGEPQKGGGRLMRESFDPNQPAKYTRKWFSWANALYAELVRSATTQCQ